MIVILDYDMGNVGSIKNMLYAIGEKDVVISNNPGVIAEADKMILPGVGAFDQGISNLKKYNLVEQIGNHVNKDKPLMGICLGMQLLGNASEEGNEKGLGLIPFYCRKFPSNMGLKVPHIGWDYIVDSDDRYYFVHSYYAVCEKEENILMKCNYGFEFAAAVNKDNIYGYQFHPEKSHKYGMELLKHFVEL